MQFAKELTSAHAAGLQWFADRTGQEMPWPGPIDGLFLVNKAKGIHKPEGFDHALSVRQSLNGPYEDDLTWGPDGRWSLAYAHEGTDPNYFTNRSLQRCLDDGVPVGVLTQVKAKPNPRYRVLGLGQVVSNSEGVFTIRQFGSGIEQAEAALDVSLPSTAFDASDKTDGRVRIMRAIAARRGQPAFRKSLIKAYGGRCAVTGCALSPVLEAAHVVPYLGDHTNHVTNGLLLRADIHTLFDLGLLTLDPETYLIAVALELAGTEYGTYGGKLLRLPEDKALWPDRAALKSRAALA